MLPPATQAALDAAPPEARAGLLALRALILDTAAAHGIPVAENLRWGQPAYLAPKGSTIRIGIPRAAGFALFVHCQTTLIAEFRAGPVAGHRFDGSRAVLFDDQAEIDPAALGFQIRRALTYHARAAALPAGAAPG
jgi:hypothetical protein